MRYKLDIEELKNNLNIKEGNSNVNLQHNTGNKISIVPYKVNIDEKVILDYRSIIGELSRLLTNKKLDQSLEQEEMTKRILQKVSTSHAEKFNQYIQYLYFNEEEQLEVFHPMIFNFIHTKKKDQKDLAHFIFSVLCEEKTQNKIKDLFKKEPADILSKLILDSLPKLSDANLHLKEYKCYVPYVREIFIEDFQYIASNSKLFTKHYEELIKYYYFYYVSQLVLQLNMLFDADLTKPQPVYFNLEWEKASKTRKSYINGWNLLKNPIQKLFAHAVCLEIINHNELDESSFSYIEFKKQYLDQMNELEKEEFIKQFDNFIEAYKKWIGEIGWSSFNTIKTEQEDLPQNKIRELLLTIDFQFNHGKRKSAYQKYIKWFQKFCESEFLKRRGSLGYCLNLTQEYLLLITKLSIKNEEKIRLNLLFEEYEKRGLYLDHESREKVIELFEKLNLLEKKSDSGDAQYVRSIL